jgi:hypothetical protein
MLAAQISRYGGFTKECCDTLKKQNLIQEKLKNLSAAINETKRILSELRNDIVPPNHPAVVETEKILADLVLKREKRKQGCF